MHTVCDNTNSHSVSTFCAAVTVTNVKEDNGLEESIYDKFSIY